MQQYVEARAILIKRLYDYTQQLEQAVNNLDQEAILSLLESRQRIMEKVDKLDSLHGFVLKQARAKDITLPEELQCLLEASSKLLKEIAQKDEMLRSKLNQARAQVKDKLKNVSQGRRLNSAYEGGHWAPEGAYFDRKK